MQQLRSHIIKLCAISLIAFGLGLCVVQPARGQHSTRSFTNWFAGIAKANHTGELTRELNRLRNSGVDLSELIEHASQIISRNNKDFDLPLGEAPASQRIYQVLLAQWSRYQTGSGMAKVPPPETVKPGTNLQIDKFGATAHRISTGSLSARLVCSKAELIPSNHSLDRSLIPMATGIAIGAP